MYFARIKIKLIKIAHIITLVFKINIRFKVEEQTYITGSNKS